MGGFAPEKTSCLFQLFEQLGSGAGRGAVLKVENCGHVSRVSPDTPTLSASSSKHTFFNAVLLGSLVLIRILLLRGDSLDTRIEVVFVARTLGGTGAF
jgi:hypothetical protein